MTDAQLISRLAEHRWRFDDADVAGVPVVSADAALDLPAVSPLHLLLAQVRQQPTGDGLLVATLRHWQQLVGTYVAEHPQRLAVNAPTLTDGMPIMPPSPVLDAWLDEQRRAFPVWTEKYGGTWDYTAGTVDALAALVFRITPTVQAFEDPANTAFTETASWYFGEMLCRAYPSRWMYRAHTRETADPRAVCFTVQANDNRDFTTPYRRLRNMLRHSDPGRLRAGYYQWADNTVG